MPAPELSHADAETSRKAFKALGICDELCDAAVHMRWKQPSDIQQQAIPPLIEGVPVEEAWGCRACDINCFHVVTELQSGRIDNFDTRPGGTKMRCRVTSPYIAAPPAVQRCTPGCSSTALIACVCHAPADALHTPAQSCACQSALWRTCAPLLQS